GTRARARTGDHAMAAPSATPAAPARTNAPTISSAVVHAWAAHGISPVARARATAPGLGRMYGRIPRLVEATCHAARTARNPAIDGRRPISRRRMRHHSRAPRRAPRARARPFGDLRFLLEFRRGRSEGAPAREPTSTRRHVMAKLSKQKWLV